MENWRIFKISSETPNLPVAKEKIGQRTDDKGQRWEDFGTLDWWGEAARCGKVASALHEPREQNSGLEGIDGHDAAIELPVIQVFCENGIAAKSFGCGDDLRIVVLNAVDALYLNGT